MKLQKSLFGIFCITLLSLGILITIFFNVDPTRSDNLTYIAFVASLFLAFWGILTFIEYVIRVRLSKGALVYSHLPVSSRHGLMISLAISLLVSMQFLHIMNIFDSILIILIISLSELYFKARPHAKQQA